MTSPFDWMSSELDQLEARSLRRTRRVVVPLRPGRCLIDGRECWNFAANDYLGLAQDPQVIQAVREKLETGIGARASALVTGRTELHQQLEERLAAFKNTESAMLFPTGFAANFATISTLVGSEDVVFCDRLNHASLIDGARYSKARLRVFPHREIAALEHELQKATGFRRRLILTDSLFSMDGDVAHLCELAELADRFDAMLLVDEAHATGVFGASGAGLLEEQQVHSPAVLSVGTLSKAIGSQGGFVAASNDVCEWLWNTARMNLYSTALSLPACVAALTAIDVIEREPQRREWIRTQSQLVKNELRSQGWSIPADVSGPILPVMIGDAEPTLQMADRLFRRGVFVAAIRPPTVPQKTSRLRISLSYAHGTEGIADLLRAFEQCLPAR